MVFGCSSNKKDIYISKQEGIVSSFFWKRIGRVYTFTKFQIYVFVGSTKKYVSIDNTIYNSTYGYQITADNNVVVTTEKYMTGSKINSNYIFAGLVIVIVLLIFGILVRLWKKSKMLERKLVLQQTSRENNRTHDSSKQNQLKSESDSTMHPCNTDHLYRPITTEYDEINEDVDMPTLSDDYEIPRKLTRSNKAQFRTEYPILHRKNQRSNLTENMLGLYLHPLFVPNDQNASSVEERNSYLEVI